MITKTRIVEHLGEGALLLPRRIRDALAANDRAKVRMAALQAALQRARDPVSAPSDFTDEARRVDLAPEALHELVCGASARDDDGIQAPGLDHLFAGLAADVEAMIAALAAGDVDETTAFEERWAAARSILAAPEDITTDAVVRAITSPAARGGDSVHRLVMDLHKRLNRLAADHADEDVAGALCSGLNADDRRAVTAFMGGLARTRPLKFDHPGLDTTAARAGERLVIQNDIGTTDAHVLCVSVRDDEVTLTYTDVHRIRAAFFVSLFDDVSGVVWSKPSARRVEGLAEDEAFHLVTGTLVPRDRAERDRFLAAIGAALVFLIDWNKARKQLQRFVGKSDAITVLRWAAEHRHGHRAFLEMGGGDLVDGAVQRTADGHIAYGVRLDRALGRDQAVDFLEQVLRIAAEDLKAGRTDRLVRDAIDAELAGRLERSASSLLQGIVAQAGLARAIVAALEETIVVHGGTSHGAETAAVAKRIEEKADRLALELRAAATRFGLGTEIAPVIDTVEQAIDELEEAAFFQSVSPAAMGEDAMDVGLGRLCAAAVRSAEAVARMADAASCVPDGHRIDVEDALAALADLVALEHEADELERTTIAAVLSSGASIERIFAVVECARRIEDATDYFARAGHLLRGHVIGGLSAHGHEVMRG